MSSLPSARKSRRSAGEFLFTSESVTEGHPDKVADAISDAVLDACLEHDSQAHVAIETLVKHDTVVVAGEVRCQTLPDLEAIVRQRLRQLGYDDPQEAFSAAKVKIIDLVHGQSPEIAAGVADGESGHTAPLADLGAGDQGLMFGYATDESPSLLPLPIHLAHALTAALAQARRSGHDFLRPDGKAQVTVRYVGGRPQEVTDVVVSAHHRPGIPLDRLRRWLGEVLIPTTLGPWFHPRVRLHLNPAGTFASGGPEADAGVTGRKIIVDTYGGFARHGGGAFSGKDATKVDRSAAYFARWAARRAVRLGLARQVEIQVAYAIGVAAPVSLAAVTSGGDAPAVVDFLRSLDFRPAAIIEQLGLRRPIFSSTTNYGHFGRLDLPWEQDDLRPLPSTR